MKKLTALLAAGALLASPAAIGQLLISGMVDGTNTGGNPKAMEIVATENIADLSVYFIARDTNGAGPFDTFFQLPSVSLNTGEFYYIYGNSDSQTALGNFGFSNGSVNSILNWNGDDILGLSISGDASGVFDSFAQVAQGDTDFAANSTSYRIGSSTTPNVAGVLDAGNFNITAYSDSNLQSSFGTFSVVPEPSTYAAIGGLLALGVVILRRRTHK